MVQAAARRTSLLSTRLCSLNCASGTFVRKNTVRLYPVPYRLQTRDASVNSVDGTVVSFLCVVPVRNEMTPLFQPLQILGSGSFCFTRVYDPGNTRECFSGKNSVNGAGGNIRPLFLLLISGICPCSANGASGLKSVLYGQQWRNKSLPLTYLCGRA